MSLAVILEGVGRVGRVIRAYKFLIRPTVGQEQALSAMLRDHCALYNAALQERRDAYRHASRTTVRYGQQSAQLKDIRAFRPGSGPLVVLLAAGHAAASGQGVRGVLPPGQGR